MKNIVKCLTAAAVAAGMAGTVLAEENPSGLEESTAPSRWRFSIGARLAPGLKVDSRISSEAAVNAVGRLRPVGSSHSASTPKDGVASTTTVEVDNSSRSSTETLTVSSDERLEFPNGFIDMNDSTIDPNETWNWHFNDASVFDEGTGSITVRESSSQSSTSTSSSGGATGAATFSSQRASFSEAVNPDISSSREADLWGGDIEVGYDFYIGEHFSVGVGLGATLYRSEDAIRAAGRCYSAASELRRETVSGHYVETKDVTTATTEDTAVTTVFTDENLAFDGSLADMVNDDGSIGAGTYDGQGNQYGGNPPILTVGNGGYMRTTDTATRTETTTTTSTGFVKDDASTSVSRRSRIIDVTAEGDVETCELRLALQPAWRAADWLELRGSFGAAATHVSVDIDATVFVDGKTWGVMSGDDDGWIVTGLCGIDAVVSPLDGLSIFVGADLRIGNNKMDYSAGIVDGTIELAKYTFRVGLGIAF